MRNFSSTEKRRRLGYSVISLLGARSAVPLLDPLAIIVSLRLHRKLTVTRVPVPDHADT
jgi:hypothetical protein